MSNYTTLFARMHWIAPVSIGDPCRIAPVCR